jgi:hypothetical protein
VVGSVATCTIGTMTSGLSRTITVTGSVLSTYATSSMAVSAAATTTTVDPITSNNTATNTATVADATVPSTPGTPTSSAITNAGVTLTWTGSTDNVAVTGYNVYRDGVLQTTVAAPALTFTDSGLAQLTTYVYTIRARDAAGNLSAVSGNRSVTTLISPPNATSYYEIRNTPGTDRCMQSPSVAGSNVTLSTTCTSSATRDWRFVPTTGNYVKINQLTPTTLVLAASGTNIQVATAASSTAQEWLLIRVNNTFQLQSRSQPTLCADRNTVTSALSLQTCDTADTGQLWAITAR